MKKVEITAKDLSTLRDSLPHGSRKIIAERTGKTVRHVTIMLLGHCNINEEIINAAIELRDEYESNQRMVNKKIKKAIWKKSWIQKFLQWIHS